PADRVVRIPIANRRNDNRRAPLMRLNRRCRPAGVRKPVRPCNEYEWRNRCANRSGPRRRERMNRFNFNNVGSSQFGQLWESELFSRGCRDDEFELIADLLSAKAVDDAPNRREVICDNSDSKLRSSRCGSGHRWANGLFLCHALSFEGWFEILGKAALPTRLVYELAVVVGYASASEILLLAMEAVALQIFAGPIADAFKRFLDVLDRVGDAEAQIAFAEIAERGPRKCGDAGVIEQRIGQFLRWPAGLRNVGENVERALRQAAGKTFDLIKTSDHHIAPLF